MLKIIESMKKLIFNNIFLQIKLLPINCLQDSYFDLILNKQTNKHSISLKK